MADERVPLRHVLCGDIGLYATRRHATGEIIDHSHFMLLDGSSPGQGEMIRCGACGEPAAWGNTVFGTMFGPNGEFRPDEGA